MKKWEKIENAILYFLECKENESDAIITTSEKKYFARYVPFNVDPKTHEFNYSDSLKSLVRQYGEDPNFTVEFKLSNQTLHFNSENNPNKFTIPAEFENEWILLYGQEKDSLESLHDWYDKQNWHSWTGIENIILLSDENVENKDDADVIIFVEKDGKRMSGLYKILPKKRHVTMGNYMMDVYDLLEDYQNIHVVLTLKGQNITYATRSMFNPVHVETTLPNTGEKVLLFGIEKDLLPKLNYESHGGVYTMRFN